jgi:putative addiction module killer protein
MVEVVKSTIFDRWLRKLKDRRAAARVQVRIDRVVAGNPGDVKPVGDGISELRIAYGPGYRLYYLQEGRRSSSCSAVATSPASRRTSRMLSG